MNKNAKTKKAVGNVFLFTVVLLYIFVNNEAVIPFLSRLEFHLFTGLNLYINKILTLF